MKCGPRLRDKKGRAAAVDAFDGDVFVVERDFGETSFEALRRNRVLHHLCEIGVRAEQTQFAARRIALPGFLVPVREFHRIQHQHAVAAVEFEAAAGAEPRRERHLHGADYAVCGAQQIVHVLNLIAANRFAAVEVGAFGHQYGEFGADLVDVATQDGGGAFETVAAAIARMATHLCLKQPLAV